MAYLAYANLYYAITVRKSTTDCRRLYRNCMYLFASLFGMCLVLLLERLSLRLGNVNMSYVASVIMIVGLFNLGLFRMEV